MTGPIQWQARRFGGDHNALAYGNGKFVAASSGSILMSSTDGATWSPTLLPGGQDLTAIGYVNGQFFLADYSPTLRTSPDGVTWTKQSLAATFVYIDGFAHNGTNYVVVGDKLNTSSNLSAWSDTTPGTLTQRMRAVATLGTKFVAVGESGQTATSPDGVTWTVGTIGDTTTYYSVSCTATLCVAVGDAGSLYTTANGTAWTKRDSKVTAGALWSIARLGTTWIVVGDNGQITTSPDGTTWTLRTSGVTTPSLYGVAASSTTVAAVGTTATRLSSADGTTWANHSAPDNPLSLATDGTTLVAVGATEALRSTDGVTFTPAAALSTAVHKVSYAGGMFFAVGDGPALFSSSDSGMTWTRRIMDDTSGNTINGVAKGATVFVAVGGNGDTPAVWLSTNGTTWTSQTPQGITGGYANFTSVIYANNMFVTTDNAFFGNSTIYTSTDGITWTDRNANTMKGLEAVVYANGTFVAVGANSIVASTDGMTWAAESSPSANHAYAVTYGAGQFRAVGNTGNGTLAEIVSSPDGVNWLDQTGPINLALCGAVYFGGLFYASGDAELIVAGK